MNLFEYRSGIFKMASIYRRPILQRKRNIGSWLWVLHFMSVMSVFTNSLLFLNGYSEYFESLQGHKGGRRHFAFWKFVQFVVIEHISIILIVLLRVIIKNTPQWVTLFLQRRDHRLKKNAEE